MLARGELRLVGATTLDEYRENIEKDPALERRFQQVFVGEPSVADTVAILRGIAPKYEAHHQVTVSDGALVAAASLSDRYITGRQLPDKAIDLIDEAASRLRMELDSSPVEIDELQRRVDRMRMEESYLADSIEEEGSSADPAPSIASSACAPSWPTPPRSWPRSTPDGRPRRPATTRSVSCAPPWTRCAPAPTWPSARATSRRPAAALRRHARPGAPDPRGRGRRRRPPSRPPASR